MAEALLIAAVIVVLWRVAVRLYPWKDCPSCTRHSGRVQSGKGTHRDCARCGATGRVRRWGAPGKRKL